MNELRITNYEFNFHRSSLAVLGRYVVIEEDVGKVHRGEQDHRSHGLSNKYAVRLLSTAYAVTGVKCALRQCAYLEIFDHVSHGDLLRVECKAVFARDSDGAGQSGGYAIEPVNTERTGDGIICLTVKTG